MIGYEEIGPSVLESGDLGLARPSFVDAEDILVLWRWVVECAHNRISLQTV